MSQIPASRSGVPTKPGAAERGSSSPRPPPPAPGAGRFREFLQLPPRLFPGEEPTPGLLGRRAAEPELAFEPKGHPGEMQEGPLELAVQERPGDDSHPEASPWLEPLEIALCRGPLGAAATVPAAAAEAPALAPPPNVEVLLDRLVRRIAWGGTGRKGAARLELGAGALSGATLTVVAEAGAVSVELTLPPGVDAEAWERRLQQRFEARGIEVTSLTVR